MCDVRHSGCEVTQWLCCHNSVCDAILSGYVINIECVMSEIQALCDITHRVNVISYRVDDISYIVHVMSSIRGM